MPCPARRWRCSRACRCACSTATVWTDVQHRLAFTRESTAAPLPGKALVVFDPQRETIEAMVPREDGHTQEPELLGQVGPLVGAGLVGLADRNFCTEGFLGELEDRGAYSLIREHAQLRFKPLEAMRGQVRPEGADSVVSEQWAAQAAAHPGRLGGDTMLMLRCLRVWSSTTRLLNTSMT